MSRRRQDQLLRTLLRSEDWATAARLADLLGVTPRSIRTYVSALNARVPAADAVASGPAGYRAGPGARAALDAHSDDSAPRERLHRIVRLLLDAADGIDVYDTAALLHVSEATVEADLTRVRALLGGGELVLERDRERLWLRGSERAQRRLLSRLAHDEMDAAAFRAENIRRVLGSDAIDADAVGAFKSDLVGRLGAMGYFVNELAIADVLLHIAIAAERVAAGHALEGGADDVPAQVRSLAVELRALVSQHFAVALGEGDAQHLARLVLTRVVAPGEGAAVEALRDGISDEVRRAVRDEVARAARDFQVDLRDDAFELRLALHVQNLVRRAAEQAWTRNPLTQTLKSSYPMIFEVAVSIAGGLGDRLDVPFNDDEIAYIAMHIGGRLERTRSADTILTATIVCPGYQELQELLRSSIDRSLGSAIEVTGVVTAVDPDWARIDTDLVLSTIEPGAAGDRFVRIPPFLNEADVEHIQQAAGRIRRGRRLARLRAQLSRYLDPRAFVQPLPDEGEERIIRRLGDLLVRIGVIDAGYIDNTIAREMMSSTGFTEALAVPHAMQMTATRTAIAIGVADGSVVWGDGRVQVVALAAFSEGDRAAFQTVFEQLVEVFSERDSVQRILRRAHDFDGFLDELVAVIDG